MSQTPALPRPDPRERLRRLKLVVLSLTGALLATLTWLVAGHPAGSAAAADVAPPTQLAAPRLHHDDDESFFGAPDTSGLSVDGLAQPLMRSSGS
jgi:hypothetical protein